MDSAPRIVIIGSGNVAWHLAKGLAHKCQLVQIYSRNPAHAAKLATEVDCDSAGGDLSLLNRDADIYIIAVNDDAIEPIVSHTPDGGSLWLHTSGSRPLEVLKAHRRHCGVLYPMQSFSQAVPVDWSEVHTFVEGNNPQALQQVTALAHLLTSHVTPCDSEQRRALHVAAVFACNFANHLWAQADELLHEHGLPFEALLPLIRTTVAKLDHLTPAESQTGPAARGDHGIVAQHLDMLQGTRRDIYDLLSRSIMEMKQKSL